MTVVHGIRHYSASNLSLSVYDASPMRKLKIIRLTNSQRNRTTQKSRFIDSRKSEFSSSEKLGINSTRPIERFGANYLHEKY